jgi:acetyl-CoA carboxylase beta subunit
MVHGMLDAIVPRHKMRSTLGQLIDILRPPKPPVAMHRDAKKSAATRPRKTP